MDEEKEEVNKISDIERKKEKIKTWLKNPYNLGLVLLLLFTIGIRLYHFSLTANQPTWWDEGDYLGLAKEIALPSPEKPEWWGHFTTMRPMLMPFVWAVFIKFGISEAIMRFLTEVLPSILLVYFVYLLGSSLFNKKIGLITGYITASYWVIQFYSNRFMTDIPSMLFAIMSVYYFWEYYEKQEKPIGLYLCIFLGVLSFLARFPAAILTLSILLFVLLKKKHKFFTDKTIWIAGFVGIATLIPYFLYNYFSKGSFFPAWAFYGSENTILVTEPALILFRYAFFDLIGWIFAILAAIGLIYTLFYLFSAFDIFWKQREKKYNQYIFIILWLVLEIFYFVFYMKAGNDRHILLWMPVIFVFISLALVFIYNIISKYSKLIGILLVLVLLIAGSYSGITYGIALTKNKLTTYQEVRDTGLWLKDNSPANAKIMGASIVQNAYYSQRRTYDFFIGTELYNILINQERNLEGQLVARSYQIIWNETELECKIDRIKPDYLILHPWEPAFTPEFMFDYPQRHNDSLMPLQTFFRDSQLMAVIYKFVSYPKIDEKKVNCTWVFDRPENITGIPLSIKDPYRLIIPS